MRGPVSVPGLPHVLDLAVHQVNFYGWMGQGDHSLYLAILLLKIRVNLVNLFGWMGIGDHSETLPCDFRVSPNSLL